MASAAWACGSPVPVATTPATTVPRDARAAIPADPADCGPVASTSDPAVIAVVRARGNGRLTRNDVCNSISVRAGDRFEAARVASDIHALWDTRAFDDVMVERSDPGSSAVLTYVVRERPLLGRVVIEGATTISPNALRSMLRLHEGDPLDAADVEAAREVIRAAYVESGYRSVKVDFTVDSASPAAAVASYRVAEGPLALVTTFTFTGVSAARDRELRALIETRKGTVNVPGSIYGESAAARTVLLVQARLYDRGLLQSHVDAPALSLSPDGKSLAVVVAVHEGPVYRIGKVTFAGALAADQPTYLKLFGQKTGDVFNRSLVMQAFERIQAMHAKLGKPVKDISPETELDPEKKTVALTIDLATL
jgi:outer membrane protein insertion porin family